MPPPPGRSHADDLFLIDAMGFIFRAYHALPPMTSPQGVPTHATLGFTNMLRKLVADYQPGYLAAEASARV